VVEGARQIADFVVAADLDAQAQIAGADLRGHRGEPPEPA
jgi:hypothetical protein